MCDKQEENFALESGGNTNIKTRRDMGVGCRRLVRGQRAASVLHGSGETFFRVETSYVHVQSRQMGSLREEDATRRRATIKGLLTLDEDGEALEEMQCELDGEMAQAAECSPARENVRSTKHMHSTAGAWHVWEEEELPET